MDGPCRILSGDLRGGGGAGVCLWLRFSEPDPSHTLEERVVHWYFSQLDSNSSSDINKREMKPFKRYVKKKAKPKKCARRFTDYCDLNKDKVISLPELKGCLGVSKEGECSLPCSWPSRTWPTQAQGPRAPAIEGGPGCSCIQLLTESVLCSALFAWCSEGVARYNPCPSTVYRGGRYESIYRHCAKCYESVLG